MYSTKKISDRAAWEHFIKSQPYTPFVQSAAYGAFYEAIGEQYWILGVYDQTDSIVGGSLILTTHAKRGNFFYLPYGPVLDYTDADMVTAFFTALARGAKKEHMDFIRISPFVSDTKEGRAQLESLGYRRAPMHVLAENTWILDVRASIAVLQAGMKKNHRNLVRRCERAGVRIEQRTDQAALDILHELLDETEKRHNFVRFSRAYINAEFEAFAAQGQAAVFLSYLPSGAIDAAAIIVFYGTMAVYRHSASLNSDKRLPTSYLIQWAVIQEAKKRGMHWYNFWGVEPTGAPSSHPFAGIGHFKRGFGGVQKDLLHCHDLPITKRYWINWLIETFRKKKRGF